MRPKHYVEQNYSVPSGKNDFMQLVLLIRYQFICLFSWYLLFSINCFFFSVKWMAVTAKHLTLSHVRQQKTLKNCESM